MKRGPSASRPPLFFMLLTAAVCLLYPGPAKGDISAGTWAGGSGREHNICLAKNKKENKNILDRESILPIIQNGQAGFEKNMGQASRKVKFLSREDGYLVFFDAKGASIFFSGQPRAKEKEANKKARAGALRANTRPKKIRRKLNGMLRMDFEGAAGRTMLAGAGRLTGTTNYLRGRDPSKWITSVPSYNKLYYQGLYPGICAIFSAGTPAGFEKNNQTKIFQADFILQPGADPGRIRLHFPGSKLSVDKTGDLIVFTPGIKALFLKPCIYQEGAGNRKVFIEGGFVLEGKNRAAFRIARYDKKRPLVIDPQLLFSTFYGGGAQDQGQGIAVDSSGNIYVTGYTSSPDFPLASNNRPFSGQTDAFVTKISLSPTPHVVYSTLLGGSAAAQANAIAVDRLGDAFITGFTSSTNFPLASPLQASLSGSRDIFITELSSDGRTILYSTYFGGSADDEANGIALDTSGNILITGFATSSDFPISQNSPLARPSATDAFAAKILAGGSQLGYSVLLGGAGNDTGAGIAADASGNAYVTGSTSSLDFPTADPRQAALLGAQNAFLTKLDPSGKIVFSTYHGGGSNDGAAAIALDALGNAYITGSTNSPNFPVLNPIQTYRGGKDIFVSKFSPSGALLYSTFLGGSADDSGAGIAVDSFGNAFVTGQTISTDFPVKNQVQGIAGGLNAFVEEINSAGSALVYSTILGGNSDDSGAAIAVDSAGDAFVTGKTDSPDFITKNAIRGYSGSTDAFISGISNPNALPSAPALISPSNGQTGLGTSVTFTWSKSTDPDGDPVTYQFFLCTNQTFQNCPPVQLAGNKSFQLAFNGVRLASGRKGGGASEDSMFSMVLFTAVIFEAKRRRKAVLLLIAVALVAGMAAVSCGGGGQAQPSNTVQKSVTGLQTGTTYFWKVTALDGRGGSADSGINSFSTK